MPEERMIDVDRKCPVCHKVFGVLDADRWVYKLRARNGEVLYFHSYGCKRKYEAEHSKPRKALAIEEEPERRTAKNYRPKQYSQDVIKKVLTAIEEGDDPVLVLQQMGYDHWKKWYDMKKWAERNDPELRRRMPEKLGVDMRRKENRKKAEENLVGGTRPVSLVEEYLKDRPDRSEALMKMIEKWDEAHKPPEPAAMEKLGEEQ